MVRRSRAVLHNRSDRYLEQKSQNYHAASLCTFGSIIHLKRRVALVVAANLYFRRALFPAFEFWGEAA